MPSISTVIPAYNAENYISNALDSVLSQTTSVSEIIIVDDGSTDNTEMVIKKYIDLHRDVKPTIRYLKQKNKGPASARNNGILHASGEFIALLDSDDQWMPHKIEKQIEKFQLNSLVALVHTGRIRVDLKGNALDQEVLTLPEGNVFNELLISNHICCSSTMIKKKCINQMGGFDESAEIHRSEDYDLWLRIAVNNEIGYLEEPLIKYRVDPNGLNRQNIEATYEALTTVFCKALNHYQGDQNKLKKEWMQNMFCSRGKSLVHVGDYGKGFLSFLKSIEYGHKCLFLVVRGVLSRLTLKLGTKL